MDTQDNQTSSMLLVRAAGRLCALPIRQVREVMRPLPIRHLDQAPACVAGVAVVRGVPVPVVELMRLISASGSAADITRFVTINVDQRAIALAVSEVVGVHAIDRTTLNALPPLLDSGREEAISALGVRDKQLLLVLDAVRLLPEGMVTGMPVGTPQ